MKNSLEEPNKTKTASPVNEVMLRERQVLAQYAPVSRSTWWRWMQKGLAPKPVHLGPHVVAWRKSDLDAWILAKSNSR